MALVVNLAVILIYLRGIANSGRSKLIYYVSCSAMDTSFLILPDSCGVLEGLVHLSDKIVLLQAHLFQTPNYNNSSKCAHICYITNFMG